MVLLSISKVYLKKIPTIIANAFDKKRKLFSNEVFLALLRKYGIVNKASYSVDASLLLEFEIVKAYGMNIRIPINRKDICHSIYGDDWEVPVRSTHYSDHAIIT